MPKEAVKRGLELGAGDSIVLAKPEYLIKLTEPVNASLAFCQDDANFRKKSSEQPVTT